jgi:hypothetical protein
MEPNYLLQIHCAPHRSFFRATTLDSDSKICVAGANHIFTRAQFCLEFPFDSGGSPLSSAT